MSARLLFSGMPKLSQPEIMRQLTWWAPSLVIPPLRAMQDPREDRLKLFIRDFSTYSLGTVIFLYGERLLQHTFERTKAFGTPDKRNLAAFLIALTGNLLYAGIGAVKLSEWLSRKWLKPSHPEKPLMRADIQLTAPRFRPYEQAPIPPMPNRPQASTALYPALASGVPYPITLRGPYAAL